LQIRTLRAGHRFLAGRPLRRIFFWIPHRRRWFV
jgi:hypothetical protein